MSKVDDKTQQSNDHLTVLGGGDASDGPRMRSHDSSAAVPSISRSFDLNRLRLPQNFGKTVGVRRRIAAVPVRKPQCQEFVRVMPEGELPTVLLHVKGERDGFYLVDPGVRDLIRNECTPSVLVVAVTRDGSYFLWPLRLPADERPDLWASSALEAVQVAQHHWVSVRANMSAGGYDVYEARGDLGEPTWPDESFEQLLELAFRSRYIDTLDHPVLRRLRGEE